MNDGAHPKYIFPPACNRVYNLSDGLTRWLYILLAGLLTDVGGSGADTISREEIFPQTLFVC